MGMLDLWLDVTANTMSYIRPPFSESVTPCSRREERRSVLEYELVTKTWLTRWEWDGN